MTGDDMTKKPFNFWQDHSSSYLEMAFRTDRREKIDHPDGYGKHTGECGDTIEFFLVIDKETIRSVSFETDGCMNTNACANTVAVLAENRHISDAWKITPEDVATYLKTLPAGDAHCAELAVGAFYLALSNYQHTQKNPWKKIYR
jgi:nitrogen fixation NifU-like protein